MRPNGSLLVMRISLLEVDGQHTIGVRSREDELEGQSHKAPCSRYTKGCNVCSTLTS